MRRRFLSPFDAGVFDSIPVRCSLVFTLRLNFLQLSRVCGVLVVRIQWIAARWQTGARRGGAVAERSADEFALQSSTLNDVQQLRWICQQHASEADEVGPTLSYCRLGDVR